jgi:hypothetical protein
MEGQRWVEDLFEDRNERKDFWDKVSHPLDATKRFDVERLESL